MNSHEDSKWQVIKVTKPTGSIHYEVTFWHASGPPPFVFHDFVLARTCCDALNNPEIPRIKREVVYP